MVSYIVASGNYCENAAEPLENLKPLVKESVGSSVRRISRFIQLALIGAGRATSELPSDTAVYLSSGRGDMAVTVDVLNEIVRHHQAPRPLQFINTVSNAGGFYVAQALQLSSANHFICSRYFALEVALQSAMLDLQLGRSSSALVGVVDVAVAPLVEHRQRLKLADNALVAEGSHWLQLANEPGDRQVLAKVEAVRQFSDRQNLSAWLAGIDLTGYQDLALGQYMAESEKSAWLTATGLNRFDGNEGVGHFDSKVGRTLCQYLAKGDGRLLYLNRDHHGRYMMIDMIRQS